MELIKWRNSYNTGIDSMDLQHKTIIQHINKLYNVIRNKQSDSSIDEILEEMEKYAKRHLLEEEILLKTHNYPALADHTAVHQLYLDTLKSLMEKSKRSDDAAVMDTYSFLRKWWTEHIMTEDKKYSEFINPKEPNQK